MSRLTKLRLRLAFMIMPKLERFMIKEAIDLHNGLRKCFGGRSIRELLQPEHIAEIRLEREATKVYH